MLCSSCLPSQALCGYKWTGLILLRSMLMSSPLFLQLQGQISVFLSHLEEGLLVPQSEALIQVYKGFPFVADRVICNIQLEIWWQHARVLSVASLWMFNVI